MLSADEYSQIMKFLPYNHSWRLASVDRNAAEAYKPRGEELRKATTFLLTFNIKDLNPSYYYDATFLDLSYVRKCVYKYKIRLSIEILVKIANYCHDLFIDLYNKYITRLKKHKKEDLYDAMIAFRLSTTENCVMNQTLRHVVSKFPYKFRVEYAAKYNDFNDYDNITAVNIKYELDMADKYDNMKLARYAAVKYNDDNSTVAYALVNNYSVNIRNAVSEVEDVLVQTHARYCDTYEKLHWLISDNSISEYDTEESIFIVKTIIQRGYFDMLPQFINVLDLEYCKVDIIVNAAIKHNNQILYQFATDVLMTHKGSYINDTVYYKVEEVNHACCTKYMRMVFKYHMV